MTSTLVTPRATASARARAAAPVTPRPAPARPVRPRPDIVEVWGQDSFPASDAPANW